MSLGWLPWAAGAILFMLFVIAAFLNDILKKLRQIHEELAYQNCDQRRRDRGY